MQQIADLGLRKHRFMPRNLRYGIFLCPACNVPCEKITGNGRINKTCSLECRPKLAKKRAAFNFKTLKLNGTEYYYRPDHPKATEKGYVRKEYLND